MCAVGKESNRDQARLPWLPAMPRSRNAPAQKGLSLSREIDPEELAVEVLALSGDAAQAQRLAADLQSRFPRHTLLNVVSIPTILAEVELEHGDPDKAVDELRQAIPFDFCEFASLAGIYVRGLAYLHMHAGREAAAEFTKIIDHPGIDPTSQRHPLARLGLARALTLQGDRENARNVYGAFLPICQRLTRTSHY